MAEQTTLLALGLQTSPNELGATPAGALVKAENCVMLAPAVIASRRGQPELDYAPADVPNEVAYYGDTPIWQVGTDTLQRDTGTAFESYGGTYTPADPALLRMKFMETAQNLYFNTDVGVYRMDDAEVDPQLAGVRVAPDFTSATVNATLDGFLEGGASAAYRLVLGTIDANDALHLGAPSGRITVQNTDAADVAASGTLTLSSASGVVGTTLNGVTVTVTASGGDSATATALSSAINSDATLNPLFTSSVVSNVITVTSRTPGIAGNSTTFVAVGTGVTASGSGFLSGGTGGVSHNVELTFPVPSTMTIKNFFRIYRTYQTASVTGGEFVDPGDEEYLTFERYFTSTDLSAGTVTFTDTNKDSFLGVPLYTNQITGEGISQANATPPYCKDMTTWNQVAWYANTKQRQAVSLQILGCGAGENGATGIRLNDTLQFGGVTLIAGSAEASLGSNEYSYVLTTSGDAGSNIEATARSIVNVINTFRDDFTAQYLSVGDPPGKIGIQSVALDDARWNVSASSDSVSVAVGGIVRAVPLLSIVTVTTSVPHGFTTGTDDDPTNPDRFYLNTSVTDGTYFPDGVYDVKEVLTSTSFTYTDAGSAYVSTDPASVRRVTPSAALAWLPPPPVAYFALAVGSLSRTGSTVTASIPAYKVFLSPGMQVVIEPSGVADANFPAGTKTIVSVGAGGTSFTYTEAGATATNTTPYRSGARIFSDPYRGIAGQNYLSYSKIQQPEAVPVLNNFPVGRHDTQILRIAAQEQALFVFKEEGVYIVTYVGGDIPYRVDLHDSTIRLYSPDSVTNVTGRTFALTNQGVVSGTNAGWRIVSTVIEQELFQYFGPTLTTVKLDAYGVSRETDRAYKIRLPALSGATTAPYNAPLAYVYSTIADAWTMEITNRRCEKTRISDDAVYLGGSMAAVYKENNTKTAADYADSEGLVVVVGYADNILTVTNTTGISAGDAVVGNSSAIVVSVDSGTELTVTNDPDANASTQTLSVVINGVTVSFTSGATAALTATALAAAINAAPSLSGVVTAAAVGSDVTVTADVAGAAGNSIGISGNAFVSSDASFLYGGADAMAAAGSVLVTGLNPSMEINGNFVGASGTDLADAFLNFTTAVNTFPLLYLVGATNNYPASIILNALTPGVAGNSISLGGTLTDVVIIDSMSGGADAVAASGIFTVDSLPMSVTAYEAIPCDIQYRTFFAGSPADEKHWRESHVHFREHAFRSGLLGFKTDQNPTGQTYQLAPGVNPNGTSATIPAYTPNMDLYPGMPILPFKYRAQIPRSVQRGSYMNVEWSIREAFAMWWLNGVTLVYEQDSERS